jgi:glutamate synthase domain-containing protein 3
MASITTSNRNRAADAVAVRANGGSLVIYGGTAPADANAALSGNTVLASLALAATAFGAAASGVATAGTITSATASASGTATFFRVLETGGSVVVFQGAAGTSGAELNLSSTAIVSGGSVSVSSLTYTQSAS